MRHGFLLIDKPAGPTSHDIVHRIRRLLAEPKVGHLGTLDPAATGLLVLGVGTKALKVIELFAGLTKEYVADIRFGATSTTYDREGMITDTPMKGREIPDELKIRTLIEQRFMGRISQVPPDFSAVSVGGERAYRKARQGKAVALPARDVHIYDADILSYAYPDLRCRLHCSAGTYIRSFAHDLGELLRVGGYLSDLRRTKVGEWSVDNAVAPEEASWTDILPLKDVLSGFPRMDVSPEQWAHLQHGRKIEGRCETNTFGWSDHLPCVLLEELDGGMLKARKVL